MEYTGYGFRALVANKKADPDPVRVIADISEALRLKPQDDEVDLDLLAGLRVMRGSAYARQKRYDLAIADFTEEIRAADSQGSRKAGDLVFVALFNRANAWDSKKDYARAIADLDDLIARSSKDELKAVVYASRARIRNHQGDVDAALGDYTEALRHDPAPLVAAIVYMNRGQIESDRNGLDKALEDSEKAVRLLPDHPLTLVFRAEILNENGRHEQALADCDQALKVEPKNVWGHNFRAWIKATCPVDQFRDGKQAVEGATLACELTKWQQTGCLETLAAAQAESGQFDEAVKWQTKVVELTTDDKDRREAHERLELFRKKQPYRDIRTPNGPRRAAHLLPELPLTSR
jgi:tetratricopeptide (TPR) repeat protein